MAHRGLAVVDGANVAYLDKTEDGKPRVSNLTAVRDVLKAMGFVPVIIMDAALRYEVDDEKQLEHLLDTEDFQQAPAGSDADYFVLSFAQDEDSIVVSNDQFEEYREQFPWIEEKRVPLMIVNGDVQLYGPGLGQSETPS